MSYLEPSVWGPHYWFFLFTIANNYPNKANETIKKKYYDLISNFPLFIPHDKIGNEFSNMLDKYPVTPYLDGKDSFIKWVHFIHNTINHKLNKDEISLTEALNNYYSLYKPKEIILREELKYKKNLLYGSIFTSLLIGCFYLYKK